MLHISAGLVLALGLGVVPAMAHIALWDPAMFGWEPDNLNAQDQVTPLADMTFDQWWFHGYINQPPAAGTFMHLPSGGIYKGQLACNKALTSYGPVPAQQTGIYACDTIGPMHTTDEWASPNPTNVKGSGISIAYESDEKKVQPEDFAVISVNYSSPWFKHVEYQIPSDLPECPEGGCICQWSWIHSELSGSEQMYSVMYRCKIDGASGMTAVPKANTANKCDYPTNVSNCTVGAKQPHYWFQKERNNNPQGTYDPPFYNGAYGFMNGAQTDLFAAVGGANTGSPAASSSAAPSVVSSQTVASSMSTVTPSASSAAPASSNVAQSIAQVIVTSRWVTGVPTGVVANATPLPSNSTAQAAASISNVSQAQAVAASSSARAAGASTSPSNSPAQVVSSSSTVSQAQAVVASSPAQAAGVSTSPLGGVVQAGATASTSTLASLPTKGATSASSGGKVCKRRKRWQKRSTTLPVGNYVESHHSPRSAKRATPHVIAQRRWEADRARRGLGKESQGKGVY